MNSPDNTNVYGAKVGPAGLMDNLYSLTELSLRGIGNPYEESIKLLLTWIQEYIGKPIQKMESLGPVCPWVAKGIVLDTIRFGLVVGEVGPPGLRPLMASIIETFRAVPESVRALRIHRVYGLILLNIEPADYAMLANYHADLKSYALGHGLMTGLFHPRRSRVSLTHPPELTLCSPIPMFLVRNLMPQDRKIVSNPEIEESDRTTRSQLFETWTSRPNSARNPFSAQVRPEVASGETDR